PRPEPDTLTQRAANGDHDRIRNRAPAWRRPGSWSASGSRTPARSPATLSPFPATPRRRARRWGGRSQAAADGRIRLIAGLALFALAAITAIARPPVALVLSLETLMGLVRRSRELEVSRGDGRAGPRPGQCPHQVAMTADDAVVSAYLHGRDCDCDCDCDTPSQRQLAAQFGVSRARVAALIGSLNGNGDPSAVQAQVPASTYTG